MNRCLKYANHHLAISSGIANQLMSLGIPSDQVSLIFNPIVPSSETIPFNPCNLVFLGRFNESHKRVNDILNAATQLQGSWSLHLLGDGPRSEEHTSELQSLMRISYAGICLKK